MIWRGNITRIKVDGKIIKVNGMTEEDVKIRWPFAEIIA